MAVYWPCLAFLAFNELSAGSARDVTRVMDAATAAITEILMMKKGKKIRRSTSKVRKEYTEEHSYFYVSQTLSKDIRFCIPLKE